MKTVFAVPSFNLLGREVEPGTSHAWMQAVGTTHIPITVIHGQHQGPVLTLAAGVHGDEFPAMFALHNIKKQIRPHSLHGTLVLLHHANLEAFHGRQIALSPVDNKNLNRVFPGQSNGTLTEQIAYFLTQQLIPHTDYLIDIHSGSWNQSLLPHVYSPVLNQPTLDAQTLAFAKALSIPHIILYDERPRDPERSISFPNTAQIRGKPSLTLEVGHLGQTTQQNIDMIVTSCMRAMQYLGMLQDRVKINEADNIRLYQRLMSVTSHETGIFQPAVKVGEMVKEGQIVGWVSDYFGERIATLHACVTGRVFMVNQTPPIRKGESVLEIAVAK